jgi:hypothetical protein
MGLLKLIRKIGKDARFPSKIAYFGQKLANKLQMSSWECGKNKVYLNNCHIIIL